MNVACTAVGLFFSSFFLHLIVWRIRIPRRQTAALLAIFLTMLPVGLVVVHVLPYVNALAPAGLWENLHVALFQVAMSLAYIAGYSILEDRSPTLTIVQDVAEAGGKGRTIEELRYLAREAATVEHRLAVMHRDGMLVAEGDRYRLTPKGSFLAFLFSVWLAVLNIQKGG